MEQDLQEPVHEHSLSWQEAVRIVFVALAAAAAWFHIGDMKNVSVIGIAGVIFGGWPIFKEAIENNRPGISSEQVIDAAAAAEFRSEHPLGKSIVAHARTLNRVITEPEKFNYTPGRGITAIVEGEPVLVGGRRLMQDYGIDIPIGFGSSREGVSEVFVAQSGRLCGIIAIADTVRPEAQRAIGEITRRGIRTFLLTGDNKTVADAVGQQLTIQEVDADLLPENKLARVRSLVASGRTVVMLGDGINDAPALTEASVGVAMGSGTDVARESADVVLIGNDFLKFAEVLAIARRTRAIIWQNFYGTIAIDTVGIGLAAFGFLNPLLAAFIHVASELAFILNSARLLPGARSHTTTSQLTL